MQGLGHEQLLDYLRQCPESKYFNFSPQILTTGQMDKRRARKLVFDMVSSAVTVKLFDTIKEEESMLEQSQQLAVLVGEPMVEENQIQLQIIREEGVDDDSDEEQQPADRRVDAVGNN